jgi:hypothetical protein
MIHDPIDGDRLAWPDLARRLRLLNTEIDLILDARPGPIPRGWLEAACANAYAERDRRLAEGAH